jgi:hypothetical protein
VKKYVLLLSLLVPTLHHSSAQVFMTGDFGQISTTYGSSFDSYKQVEPSSPYVGIGLGAVLFGHSQRAHGVNFSANFDGKFPFDQTYPAGVTDTSNLGNPFEFGLSGLVNYRYKSVGVGVGFEARSISATDDPGYSNSTFERPSQWLFGVPVIGKIVFGPGSRAYVQGGGVFYAADYASTSVSDAATGLSGTISTGTFTLDSNHTSAEFRAAGGYMFGHWGLRANYSHRNVYFMVTGVNAPAGFYDMHQDMVSGGIILTTF